MKTVSWYLHRFSIMDVACKIFVITPDRQLQLCTYSLAMKEYGFCRVKAVYLEEAAVTFVLA